MLSPSRLAAIASAAAIFIFGAVYARSERQLPSFDAASVKLLPPPISYSVHSGGGPGTSDPGRVTRSNVTLGSILVEAFRMPGNLITGMPGWMPSERYEIIAVVPHGAARDAESAPATDSSPWSPDAPAADAAAFEASAQPLEVPAPQEASVSSEAAHATSSEAVPQYRTNHEQPAEESMHASTEELANEVPAPPTVSERFNSEVEASPESTSPALVATRDPDMAATTAAAWASWRRSREGAVPGTPAVETSSEPTVSHITDAAMAVAAGAENSPEDVASALESDSSIASIVDSVLAGLRPKIVEEISRKLGKKK